MGDWLNFGFIRLETVVQGVSKSYLEEISTFKHSHLPSDSEDLGGGRGCVSMSSR